MRFRRSTVRCYARADPLPSSGRIQFGVRHYRRDDTGWAANAVADALRRRLGPTEVFLDNRSISLGQAFDKVLRDGVRHAAVLIVLIGPRWAEPPLGIRLDDDADWVRQEILLAQDNGSDIIPVLVDQPTLPDLASLPGDLQFLASLQAGSLRQGHPHDVDLLAVSRLTSPGAGRVRPAYGR